jgi:hypothetical protein
MLLVRELQASGCQIRSPGGGAGRLGIIGVISLISIGVVRLLMAPYMR